MKIRVATYNIHKGVSSIRTQPRVHALKKAITQFNADVVFLQEVQGRHDRLTARYGEESRGHRNWQTGEVFTVTDASELYEVPRWVKSLSA